MSRHSSHRVLTVAAGTAAAAALLVPSALAVAPPPQVAGPAPTAPAPTPPAPGTHAPAAAAPVLQVGSSGPAVYWLQLRLAQLGFLPGTADGEFGPATQQAVIGAQKLAGIARTGKADTSTSNAIGALNPVTAMPAGCGKVTACVDLKHQLLYIRDGSAIKLIAMSSGSGGTYVSPTTGETERAYTPTGAYKIYRKQTGLRVGPLGALYYPSYFVYGWAIHGADSVPTYPASHGCVRVPRWLEMYVYNLLPVGAPIHIL
jgi:peptidoglycan hydrolase-like protein with peptidoglycan-binding domain